MCVCVGVCGHNSYVCVCVCVDTVAMCVCVGMCGHSSYVCVCVCGRVWTQ